VENAESCLVHSIRG